VYKLTILTVGKAKESWLQIGLEEYTMRLKGAIEIHWRLAKDEKTLSAWLHEETYFIALDPKGKLQDSEVFSSFLFREFEHRGCRLSLAIGGADGFSPEIKAKASHLISLSPLTFTHQLTRLILLEQLYRALEIRRGSPYHK
jgi:23S rRNA (pseudouridine1915-N3)-methyltransferase